MLENTVHMLDCTVHEQCNSCWLKKKKKTENVRRVKRGHRRARQTHPKYFLLLCIMLYFFFCS